MGPMEDILTKDEDGRFFVNLFFESVEEVLAEMRPGIAPLTHSEVERLFTESFDLMVRKGEEREIPDDRVARFALRLAEAQEKQAAQTKAEMAPYARTAVEILNDDGVPAIFTNLGSPAGLCHG